MQITTYGRASCQSEDYRDALIAIATQAYFEDQGDDEVWLKLGVYTAMRLCVDANGVVEMSDENLCDFTQTHGEVIAETIQASRWIEHLHSFAKAANA